MISPIISVILGLLRIFGFKSMAFQAFAHLWVGFLIGSTAYSDDDEHRRWLDGQIVGLVVIEIACAFFGVVL